MTPDRIRKRYIIATGFIIGLKVIEIAPQIRCVTRGKLRTRPLLPKLKGPARHKE